MFYEQLLDRETRREKVIEAKNREIRLKMKSCRVDVEPESAETKLDQHNSDAINALLLQCEQDYETALAAVLFVL